MDDARMLPCDQVVEKLWEYIDGELPPDDETRVREHLEMCARCFPHFDFDRAYRELVRRNAERPMPASVRHRVFEALLAEEGVVAPPCPVTAAAGAGREVEETGNGRGLFDRLRGAVGRLFGGG